MIDFKLSKKILGVVEQFPRFSSIRRLHLFDIPNLPNVFQHFTSHTFRGMIPI